MPYKPISDYGLIGDMHSAALVGLDGSIDWLCFPRFDSPSVFAAILDDAKGGRFRLAPTTAYRSKQRYQRDTNMLCTTFTTDGGQVEVLDLMPIGKDAKSSDHVVLRIIRGLSGSMELECLFEPRLDYARGSTRLRSTAGGVIGEKDEARLALTSPVALKVLDGTASAIFPIQAGDDLAFMLQWGAEQPPSTTVWREQVEFTAHEWQDVADNIEYEGSWRDELVRSVLVLHLLLYMPTGALVAAPTTSLPEWVGSNRNWDYRYCWIRDSAFIMDAFHRLGHIGETMRLMEWLVAFCTSCGDRLQTLYGVVYEEELTEKTLDHLEGYRCSKPVRIGNAASKQLQMDIFGEFMVACSTFHRAGGAITDDMWATIESFAQAVMDNWRRPDRGIWEVRGRRRRHFVHSKVMCWLALDRSIAIGEATGRTANLARWRRTRDTIHRDVLRRGWNEQLQSFVQYYGAEHTDAALLMLPMVGFLPATDPRMRSTAQRIREELDTEGMLRRYLTQRTDDGVGGPEGVLTMCTLWLVGYLTSIGELDDAQALFERLLGYGNHLGLFSEMVDPRTGDALGNFPQAFTHVSLIHTIRNLDLALRRREAPPPEEMQVGATAPSPS